MIRYLILTAMLCLSAAPANHYQAVALIYEEHKLNSTMRPGGQSRAMLRIAIPPHCGALVYSFMTSPANPLSDLGLHTQLRDHIKKDGVGLGIGSTLLNGLTVPPGDGVTNIYIMDSINARNFMRRKYSTYMEQNSRLNVANGIVIIPIKYSKDAQIICLCLENKSAFDAEFVTIEIDAMKRL